MSDPQAHRKEKGDCSATSAVGSRQLTGPDIKSAESARLALSTAISVAAVAASAVIVRTLTAELQKHLKLAFVGLSSSFSARHTIVIEEKHDALSSNHIFNAVKAYLLTIIPTSLPRLKVSKKSSSKPYTFSIEPGKHLIDNFQGAQFKWRLIRKEDPDVFSSEKRRPPTEKISWQYELSFNKKHKETVLSSYLPYIVDKYKEIKAADKKIKLYMNSSSEWNEINLNHPATFDTVAMDLQTKQFVIDDLARFLDRKEYYEKIGKTWKRGYLLYGPPGTGKSSLVAAMANYLKFNIYDLEISNVKSNDQLRRLLFRTTSRSIILVEDIDCSVQLQGRKPKAPDYSTDDEIESDAAGANRETETSVSLSGMLNFVDGLWSSFGEERIFVFTTNHKDRLDPALLRPGRMDVHIAMGYCRISGFKQLALNYHDGADDEQFGEIEGLLEEVDVTPAEVTERLLVDDREAAIRGLVEFILKKKMRKKKGKSEEKECCDLDG